MISHPDVAALLAAIVESSDDAIVSKDLNGIVTSWNRGAERIFGYTASEMIGRSIRIIVPHERRTEEDEVLGRIRRGESIEHFETVRVRKDGTLIPISLTVSPVRAANGTIVGASKIARDISDRRAAEAAFADLQQRLLTLAAENARAYDEARRANRLKDEFLGTLSHELRTPLNAILGYTRMVRTGIMTGAKQPRALEVIERNAKSLTQIVEDVLDVSRIIAGKICLNVQAVDVAKLLIESMETIVPAATAKGVRLETVVEPLPAPISGDSDRLRQVVWNLLSNAVKFTPSGGHVQMRLERADSQVDIIVSDTGSGINEEFLPHIFERFRQADSSSARQSGGLGLGLAISRHIVEMHGGTIMAASDGEGKGSTLRVTLPIVLAHTDELPGIRPVHPPVGRSNDVVRQELTGLRVVAVDDDPDALVLLSEILEAAGAQVTTANSGAKAMEALAETTPDVLVADLGMPGLDGFDLIARIRRSSHVGIRRLPAAALTAYALSEDKVKALRSGFQMHLAKPIEPSELIAAVFTLAGKLNQSTA